MIKKNYEELFQDRVDELLLLEQRADRRAEKFIDITSDYQEKYQKALDDIDASLTKINTASDQVRNYADYSAKHALRTVKLFLGTVIFCVLFIAGTLWWSNHIMKVIAQDKAYLAELDTKLKHTPVIMPFKGKDYVRVVPNSELSFTRSDGNKVPGRYSQVWHVR